MRFVPTKSIEQQDIQALHRVRTRRVAERTALGNQIRGLLLEYGIAIGLSLITLREKVPEIIVRDDNELTPPARAMFREPYEELVELEGKIAR